MKGDADASALYAGSVVHRRLRPRAHRLSYRIFSLLVDLDGLDALDARLRLFSRNRFNLFSFHDRDYGDGSGSPLRAQVERHMRAAGMEPDGGPIQVLTMPRLAGYAFNPISLFFCHRRDGSLMAVLYEVNNTFGQRHAYLMPAEAGGDGIVRQSAAKCFYVSPFMDMELAYSFRLRPPGERFALGIVASDRAGPVLTAVHRAERRPLTDRALAGAFLAYPLMTLKVIAGIHWEALFIRAKGIRLRRRPPPPAHPVTMTPVQLPKELPAHVLR